MRFVEEVGAEVEVAAAGVGEEVPDDYEDRTGDGDESFEFAAAADEAAVAGSQAAWPGHLPAEHSELVTQDQDLDLVRGL